MRRLTSIVAGILLGGMVGAALGLLFAPYSGSILRNNIVDYTNKLRDEIKQAAAERRIELEQQLSDLRTPVK
jgi:gas vesicle protein